MKTYGHTYSPNKACAKPANHPWQSVKSEAAMVSEKNYSPPKNGNQLRGEQLQTAGLPGF
jgi:hypothetical protein